MVDFPDLLEAGIVTVAQTGSIGEAFVQLEPCAVNDDCLVLLPRRDGNATRDAELLLAAATIRLEKWRFNYGRKLTPRRIAQFPFTYSAELLSWVHGEMEKWQRIAEAAVAVYEPAEDLLPV